MALIDLVKWNAPADVYAWKYPSEELSTATQLIVSESQEAVLLRGGQMVGPFGPGRHTLATENIPLLSKIFSIPFGGRSPFTAEVWFVNRAMPLDVKWGTSDPIQVLDPKYRILLPVRAFGQFGVQVTDTKQFLLKLVGTLRSFDRNQLVSYFRGLMLSHAKDAIAKKMVNDRVSLLEVNTQINAISDALRNEMQGEFAAFGLGLINFFVHSINTPDDDPAVLKLRDALSRRAEMDIVGYTYQQERSFDALDSAASNPGSPGSNLMGAGIGLGMGLGIGGPMGTAMNAISQQLQVTNSCPTCHAQVCPGSRFCSGCGCAIPTASGSQVGETIVCRNCRAEIRREAKFCSACGKQTVIHCAKCNAEVPPQAKFCPECGTAAGGAS